MKIESPYKTALIITLLSILLITLGYPMFLMFISGHFHFSLIENTITGLLKLLLQPIGFLIFLLAFTIQPGNPSESTKMLFVISSIHIFFGTVFATTNSLTFIGIHDNYYQQVLHLTTLSLSFLSGLCLSIFVFLQYKGALPPKKLSKAIVVFNLIVLLSTIIYSYAFRYWPAEDILYCISSILPILGFFAYLAAVILFFLAWKKQGYRHVE